MQEITLVSGKGGTGKTSITAAFALINQNMVLADCDVDASDLHLILSPDIIQTQPFIGGKKAKINADLCSACGSCYDLCRFDAIAVVSKNTESLYSIDPIACEGCGVCVWNCPESAITLKDNTSGESYVSKTRAGIMVHAKLFAAQENSGKLVTEVRKKAREIAKENNNEIILIDGPPGISCPVIASITNTQKVIIVVEPSLSGIHDLLRIHELIDHFKIKSYLIINRWDTNTELTQQIEQKAEELHMAMVGKIPYTPAFIESQIQGKSITEYDTDNWSDVIQNIWSKIMNEN